MNYGFTIPASGWRILAGLVAGGVPLELTRVMVGTGKVPEDQNPGDLADLIAPKALATSTVPVVEGNTVSFVVEYRSDLDGGLEEGFWLGEFGVYALDKDGKEALLYYATLGDYPQYVSAMGQGTVDIRRFPVSITLTDQVEVVVSYPTLAFMTAQDVKEYISVTGLPGLLEEARKLVAEHNKSADAHQDLRNQIDTGLAARIQRLEDMLLNDVTGNPYVITFGELEGLEVAGVWNREMQRIEF